MRTIVLLTLLLATVPRCAAQFSGKAMMNTSQYPNYMNELDAAAERWQGRFRASPVLHWNRGR